MDDPNLSWPFWKFGLKRDDLFTTLQDQYNTFPSSIQDPEAFHHDVFELSHAASTAAEFHRLMSERKQCRLRELNDSLQSASFEIIANPSLIGTDQWQYAVQLFRTRSLDSLVRYFASYLPDDHPWHRSDEESSSSSSTGDSESVHSIAHSEHIDDFGYNDKPTSMDDEAHHHLPLSPRSMTMYSASSAASQIDDLEHGDFSLTPARTMSFSESEPDHCPLQDSCPSLHRDGASSRNLSDEESSVSSVSDASETHQKELLLANSIDVVDHENEFATTQFPLTRDDGLESETPTPKPKSESMSTRVGGGGASFFPEPKPSRSALSSSCSALLHIRRSASPTRMHMALYPAATATTDSTDCHPLSAADCREIKHRQKHSPSPARPRRRDLSPVGKGRRTPGGVVVSSSNTSSSSSSRIQKPSESLRSRPRSRKRDGC